MIDGKRPSADPNLQVLPAYSQGGKGEPVANRARPSVQVFASATESQRIARSTKVPTETGMIETLLTRVTLGKSGRVGQRELHGTSS